MHSALVLFVVLILFGALFWLASQYLTEPLRKVVQILTGLIIIILLVRFLLVILNVSL